MRTYEEAWEAAREGSPFSNGDEGHAWEWRWCGTCVHDKGNRDGTDIVGCPLLGVALMGRTPSEWLEQPWQPSGTWPNGKPRTSPVLGDTYHCVEYRDEDDPGPGYGPAPEPPLPGQEVLFDDETVRGTRMFIDVVAEVRPKAVSS